MTPIKSKVEVKFVKNKGREYDLLENSKNKAASAYRKLTKTVDAGTREKSKNELLKVVESWGSILQNVDYKNKKAVMNRDVAKIVFFNLMTTYIYQNDKKNAEIIFEDYQSKMIDLDLNDSEKRVFQKLESKINKL